jgi:hypothetical protein
MMILISLCELTPESLSVAGPAATSISVGLGAAVILTLHVLIPPPARWSCRLSFRVNPSDQQIWQDGIVCGGHGSQRARLPGVARTFPTRKASDSMIRHVYWTAGSGHLEIIGDCFCDISSGHTSGPTSSRSSSITILKTVRTRMIYPSTDL